MRNEGHEKKHCGKKEQCWRLIHCGQSEKQVVQKDSLTTLTAGDDESDISGQARDYERSVRVTQAGRRDVGEQGSIAAIAAYKADVIIVEDQIDLDVVGWREKSYP